MATRTLQEEVDLSHILKNIFSHQTDYAVDGDMISLSLAKAGVRFEPKELIAAIERLYADGYIRFSYQAISGIPPTWRIGFAPTDKLKQNGGRIGNLLQCAHPYASK